MPWHSSTLRIWLWRLPHDHRRPRMSPFDRGGWLAVWLAAPRRGHRNRTRSGPRLRYRRRDADVLPSWSREGRVADVVEGGRNAGTDLPRRVPAFSSPSAAPPFPSLVPVGDTFT